MADMFQLGVTYELSNCKLTRIDLDDEHFYFIKDDQFPNGQFCASVTNVIDKAGPVDSGLREFWKQNTKQESEALLEERGKRGSKLHNAFEELISGLEINLKEEYRTDYEKKAITTFVRFFRFLEPTLFKSELVLAHPGLLLAGTLDFVGLVDMRRLAMLADPNKYLNIDDSDNYVPKDPSRLEGEPSLVKIVIDWKTSSGIHYAHRKQVIAYREMYNDSYADERPVTHCAIWRVSSSHKHGFQLELVEGEFESFKRLYDTYLDVHGGQLPKPPEIVVYPDKVKLLDQKGVEHEVSEDQSGQLRQTVEVS